MSGGSALAAFHLGHRLSDDLDFFSEGDVPVEVVLEFLRGLEIDPTEVGRFFRETARRWVLESLDDETS